MNVAMLVGLLLMILGAVSLAFRGITYTKNRETVGVGPIQATVEQKETILSNPILGGIVFVAGAALFVTGRRGRKA